MCIRDSLDPKVGTRKYVAAWLDDVGFNSEERWKLGGVGSVFDYLVIGKGRGNRFAVDILGSAGLPLPPVEDFYRAAARAAALAASTKKQPRYVVIVGDRLPARHEGHKLLRTLGPSTVFDVINLNDAADMERFARYQIGHQEKALPGWW